MSPRAAKTRKDGRKQEPFQRHRHCGIRGKRGPDGEPSLKKNWNGARKVGGACGPGNQRKKERLGEKHNDQKP